MQYFSQMRDALVRHHMIVRYHDSGGRFKAGWEVAVMDEGETEIASRFGEDLDSTMLLAKSDLEEACEKMCEEWEEQNLGIRYERVSTVERGYNEPN